MDNEKLNVNEVNELGTEELEGVAGGRRRNDDVHNLSKYVSRTVCNLPRGKYLVMQKSPRGRFLDKRYKNGDTILVHRSFYENGYLVAYSHSHDLYGFVDARYVNW